MRDHEHHTTTRRHQYRYLFTHKHHGGHGDGQWLKSLSEDVEFAVFDSADGNPDSSLPDDEVQCADEHGNLYGATPDGDGSLVPLGTFGEQVAKVSVPVVWQPVARLSLLGIGQRRTGKRPQALSTTDGVRQNGKDRLDNRSHEVAPRRGETRMIPTEYLEHPPGFETCWVGPHPLQQGGVCVGSLDGNVQFMDEQMRPQGGAYPLGQGEAINGVAGTGMWVGASTRHLVDIRWFGDLPIPKEPRLIPHGAHDILSLADGRFVAPLGAEGIMVIRPAPDLDHSAVSYSSAGLYVYRLVAIPGGDGPVLACAARQSGILAGKLGEPLAMRKASFDDEDIVDVCWIEGRAVAGLSRSGRIILIRDILEEKPAVASVRLQKVKGVGYRVFHSRGHIIVLTSKGLHVVADLARKFLRREFRGDYQILKMPMETLDANMVGERWLFVVLPRGVHRLDAAVLDQVVQHQLSMNGAAEDSVAGSAMPLQANGDGVSTEAAVDTAELSGDESHEWDEVALAPA